MDRAQGETAIEAIIRKITHTPRGRMKIQRWHVKKAINTNAAKSHVGQDRADKTWGWVAKAVDLGEHALKDKATWSQDWLSAEERTILRARADVAWGGGESASRRAHRMEVTGAVATWISENEEPAGEGAQTLRPQKMNQMMAAKKAMTKSRGGVKAIYAAMTILTVQGKIRLSEIPRRRHNKGEWITWREEAVQWMLEHGWMEEEEAEKAEETIRGMAQQGETPEHIVVDVGEGWGSVRRALQALPGVRVIGVDRRGHTNTGRKHGVITAAVDHDLTIKGKEDLLTTLGRKVGSRPERWTLLWLSLECSSMSVANAMNQATGSAHGKWAQSSQNKSAATCTRIQQEEEYLRETIEVLRNVVEALEKHPTLHFALENPASSQTWKEIPVTDAMARNKHWRLVRVDQCAYGRKSQKPTKILTNLQRWEPAGMTGNGRCEIGKCAGTRKNGRGDNAHEEQTVPNSKKTRPAQGVKQGGRWDYTKEAVTNAVAADLTQEVMRAAIQAREESGAGSGAQKRKHWAPLAGRRRREAARE